MTWETRFTQAEEAPPAPQVWGEETTEVVLLHEVRTGRSEAREAMQSIFPPNLGGLGGPSSPVQWTLSTNGRTDYAGTVATWAEYHAQQWFHVIDKGKALAVAPHARAGQLSIIDCYVERQW